MQETTEFPGTQVTKNIRLGPDGVYRWAYEFNMLKNPTILFTVCKVMGLAFGITWLLITVMDLIAGNGLDSVLGTTKVFLIIAAVFAVIIPLGYFLTAAIYKGKYMVLFEMSEDRVVHIQMPKQVEKAEAIGMLTALVGLAAGRPSVAGTGLLAMSKSTSTSEFASVRTVKIRRRLQTIHVNQLLDKNQVYAYPEDFDFVADYIRKRCVNAKIR